MNSKKGKYEDVRDTSQKSSSENKMQIFYVQQGAYKKVSLKQLVIEKC